MIELLRERRSIRRYTSEKVGRKEIDLLAEAVLRSPSSKGLNPWELLFVAICSASVSFTELEGINKSLIWERSLRALGTR